MLRDVATASLLGMSAGGVMDSFVLAFRIPDVARRLFGDGALSVGFIPVFARLWQNDRQKAWALLSAMLVRVFLLLGAGVLVGEGLCLLGMSLFSPESKVYLVAHLLALLLPYLVLICMAAIATAALQTLGRFFVPALVPLVLNIVWLLSVSVFIPRFSGDPVTQCLLLTLSILIAGTIQLGIHFPVLRSIGFRFRLRPQGIAFELRQAFQGFFPQLLGLMALQINLLTVSVIAWLFSGPADGTIRWLGYYVSYPLRPGAASSIYYSERLYEFPQGLIGLAVATAIYPLLSRHAATRDFQALGEDFSFGMRFQLVFSIPAGVGLMLMSERLAHLLFQRGAFSPTDTFRVADMIFWFGCGVWAFCSLPIIIRAFYVLGDVGTPFRIGLLSVVLNFFLGMTLIWPMREEGLALTLSLTAAAQSLALFLFFVVKHGHVDRAAVVKSALRACLATFLMALVVAVVMKAIPGQDSASDIIHIVVGGCVGMFVYFVALRLFGGREAGVLVRGRLSKKPTPQKTRKRR